jgi:hypothetical protein
LTIPAWVVVIATARDEPGAIGSSAPSAPHARCPLCLHQGTVSTFITKVPNLVCKKCGNRDVVITARDTMRGLKNKKRR